MLRQLVQSFCILLPQAATQVINGTVLRVVVPSACRVPTPLNTGVCSLVALWEIGSAQVSTFFRKSISMTWVRILQRVAASQSFLGWPNCTFSHVLKRQVGKSNCEEMVKDSAQNGLKHILNFILSSIGHVIDNGGPDKFNIFKSPKQVSKRSLTSSTCYTITWSNSSSCTWNQCCEAFRDTIFMDELKQNGGDILCKGLQQVHFEFQNNIKCMHK